MPIYWKKVLVFSHENEDAFSDQESAAGTDNQGHCRKRISKYQRSVLKYKRRNSVPQLVQHDERPGSSSLPCLKNSPLRSTLPATNSQTVVPPPNITNIIPAANKPTIVPAINIQTTVPAINIQTIVPATYKPTNIQTTLPPANKPTNIQTTLPPTNKPTNIQTIVPVTSLPTTLPATNIPTNIPATTNVPARRVTSSTAITMGTAITPATRQSYPLAKKSRVDLPTIETARLNRTGVETRASLVRCILNKHSLPGCETPRQISAPILHPYTAKINAPTCRGTTVYPGSNYNLNRGGTCSSFNLPVTENCHWSILKGSNQIQANSEAEKDKQKADAPLDLRRQQNDPQVEKPIEAKEKYVVKVLKNLLKSNEIKKEPVNQKETQGSSNKAVSDRERIPKENGNQSLNPSSNVHLRPTYQVSKGFQVSADAETVHIQNPFAEEIRYPVVTHYTPSLESPPFHMPNHKCKFPFTDVPVEMGSRYISNHSGSSLFGRTTNVPRNSCKNIQMGKPRRNAKCATPKTGTK